ncbi:MAG: CheA signal transduction histidine kinase [Betaproteobacteria bacterium]|nr:CheA signal transduction histidine kinase [Betaproteobacteria bacterium]
MSINDEAFLEQLRATFQIEAQEHLQTMSSGLLELEKTPGSAAAREIVEAVFRAAHSLKGAARAVDLIQVEALCESIEDVFASWKQRGGTHGTESLDSVHRKLEAIALATAQPRAAQAPSAAAPAQQLPPRAQMHASSAAQPAAAPAPAAQPRTEARPASTPNETDAHETVRIPVRKLEAQLRESQELLSVKLAAAQRVADLQALGNRITAWRDSWAALEPDVRQMRQRPSDTPLPTGARAAPALGRLMDFLESGRHTLKSIEDTIALIRHAAEHDRHAAAKLTDDLLEESKTLLLLPFGTISAAFPKLVRDLCRDQGKEVDFRIHGEDVEIDRRILEEVKDPIIHLLRNAIDHGVESPQARARAGKPARAAVALTVSRINGSKAELLLTDDGAGIDTARVRQSAVRNGVISALDADCLTEAQAQALIFESAVSTSPAVTAVSGRGLGLAIVREKAEKLGGLVTVESLPGAGTAFRLVMPATVATFRGILVEAAGRLLVVPTAQVERVSLARPEDVKSVEGRDTLTVDGKAVALVQLADILELPVAQRMPPPAGGPPVVVLASGDQRIAFGVDAVLGEQEVLLKPLCKPLVRVRNVAAATVLGSGAIAPVLNVSDLFRSARKMPRGQLRTAAPAKPARTESRSILVAEDSITSRMLLKTILESAGYRVKLAVDGMDALTLLRTENFDLLVSDVEMPRLNGFDLTARIRADGRLKALPVILVTALATREDREHGMEVGANAYIVKGSFDQSNLLSAVSRLI